jgi:hypothetical protein
MKYCSYLFFAVFSFTACAQQAADKHSPNNPKKVTPYGKQIPFMLGIHFEYEKKDSLKIMFVNQSDSVAFLHRGVMPGWGMNWVDAKIRTGNYDLVISWYDNDTLKTTRRPVVIKPETQFFSLNVEWANQPGRRFNALYLDQYTKGLAGVAFRRNWNAKMQYEHKKKLLVPDYEVTNGYDSTLYGAYLRQSSMLSINWVQPHEIGFMRFERKEKDGWQPMPCNAPRIQMNLKKGAVGKTLTDMELGCAAGEFKKGIAYRIRIDYMTSQRIFEQLPPAGGDAGHAYMEQAIHMFTDEFEIN